MERDGTALPLPLYVAVNVLPVSPVYFFRHSNQFKVESYKVRKYLHSLETHRILLSSKQDMHMNKFDTDDNNPILE
jgi:hypothetical protein